MAAVPKKGLVQNKRVDYAPNGNEARWLSAVFALAEQKSDLDIYEDKIWSGPAVLAMGKDSVVLLVNGEPFGYPLAWRINPPAGDGTTWGTDLAFMLPTLAELLGMSFYLHASSKRPT